MSRAHFYNSIEPYNEDKYKRRKEMKIGVSVGIWGKKWELYWGKADAKYALVELSGTVLTAQVAIYLKV